MGIPRSLALHESALSPAEYATYVSLFTTLVEPPDTSIGVREVRGWLKGRYSSIEGTTIDKVCHSTSTLSSFDVSGNPNDSLTPME
jgi:hypothetical protein